VRAGLVAALRVARLCCHPAAWRRLERADLAVVFPIGTDVLRDAHPEVRFVVIDPRETAIHAPTALRCILSGRPSVVDYLDAVISRIAPRIVMTFVDNFEPFMWLKDRHPATTFVTVQNGVRGLSGDLLGSLARDGDAGRRPRRVDHAFVFGPAIAERLGQRIEAQFHPVGSFRSNAVPVRPSGEDLIGYISTRRTAVDPMQHVAIHDHGRMVRQREVYAAYDRVAIWLHGYASRHGLRLLVIGKDEDADADRRHYETLLGSDDFEYSARARWGDSYRALDRCRVATFTSSSLGYEAMGRGIRVAALLTWTEVTGSASDRFGWPLDLPADGPFWTHRHDEVRFSEILDWLRTSPDSEWTAASRPIVEQIVVRDSMNSSMMRVIDDASAAPSPRLP